MIKNFGIASRLFIGFIILLIILAGAIFISSNNSDRLINDANWIVHTEEVINHLDDILIELIDAETGQRGFIITGDEKYLGPYNSALLEIDEEIKHIRSLISDNPSQQEKLNILEPMIEDKFNELEETINLKRSGFDEEAKQIILTDKGKQIMDDIRDILNEMEIEENKLLVIRSRSPLESKKTNNNLLLILLITGILSGIFIAYFTFNSISKPIKKLTYNVDEISKGNFEIQLDKSNILEIQVLTDSLNRVLASMKLAILRAGISKKELGLDEAFKEKIKIESKDIPNKQIDKKNALNKIKKVFNSENKKEDSSSNLQGLKKKSNNLENKSIPVSNPIDSKVKKMFTSHLGNQGKTEFDLAKKQGLKHHVVLGHVDQLKNNKIIKNNVHKEMVGKTNSIFNKETEISEKKEIKKSLLVPQKKVEEKTSVEKKALKNVVDRVIEGTKSVNVSKKEEKPTNNLNSKEYFLKK